MAVAIEDHDVAWRDQGLVHHFVRGARPVGHEENAVRSECARRHFLRQLDVAGRLEKAVEAPGRGAALGQQQIETIELAHIADPIGLEDRLAASDR